MHSSIIAQITQDKIVLNSCSWKTPTTKDRMNKILSDNRTGYTIYQKHFTWYVWGNYNGSYPTNDYREHRVEFYDGITFIHPSLGIGWIIDK